MRLDPEDLQVQSFSTVDATETKTLSSDTGEGGPASQCWVCYNTDFGLPSCAGGDCGCRKPDTGPDGPPSQCWICYNTDYGLPTCPGSRC